MEEGFLAKLWMGKKRWTNWVCWGAACAVLAGGVRVSEAQGAAKQDKKAAASAEVRLTKEQERVLLGDIDATLKFASDDSKLEIKRPVKGSFLSREQMNAELRKKFDDDEGEKRMERSELVLKKFGLLDRDFHLRPFLLSLLTEQIAGFYDDKTHTMTLLDWVPEQQQLPVMAHELTHALQDQRVGLTKYDDQEAKGIARNVAEDNHHIQLDEVDTARQAAVEGQAQVVYTDYALKPTSLKLYQSPELLQQMMNDVNDMSDSPIMARAPLLLQQSLLFPYNEGVAFEAAVESAGGVQRAFAGVLDEPPNSSFQILHPQAYLSRVPVPVMNMPDIHPMIETAGYEPYDVGVMGEVDVRMTTELFGGRPLAEALSPAWKGGIYYAAQKKVASPAEKESTASLALLYSSRWADSGSARDFFTVYDNELPRKYASLTRRTSDEKDDSERVYSSNEGDVLLTVVDDHVFVGEGLPVALERTIRDAIDGAQGTGPVQQASVGRRYPELTGGMIRWLHEFGMMKAGLLQQSTWKESKE